MLFRSQVALAGDDHLRGLVAGGVAAGLHGRLHQGGDLHAQAIDLANIAIAGMLHGLQSRILEMTLEYLGTRVQFDRPIGGFQLVQRKLAEMATSLDTGFLLAHRIGQLKDAHKVRAEQISMGKFNNVRASLDIAREARQILGANGITLEYPVIRHMNNLESVITYEGTHDIHSLVLGEALTGIPAYKG